MIWGHAAATALNALLHLDILCLLERTRWRQCAKSQLSFNTFFNFLVPENWIILNWLEVAQFMSEPDNYCSDLQQRYGDLAIWDGCLTTGDCQGFEKWEFPRICWNPESETKIYSSQTSPCQAGWQEAKGLSSLSFIFNNSALGQNLPQRGCCEN